MSKRRGTQTIRNQVITPTPANAAAALVVLNNSSNPYLRLNVGQRLRVVCGDGPHVFELTFATTANTTKTYIGS